jgi:hypothetical protein
MLGGGTVWFADKMALQVSLLIFLHPQVSNVA